MILINIDNVSDGVQVWGFGDSVSGGIEAWGSSDSVCRSWDRPRFKDFEIYSNLESVITRVDQIREVLLFVTGSGKSTLNVGKKVSHYRIKASICVLS
uniref:Uncharacterized protein n=1 Tax=Brugia malayi TaxID=6279 RepID=A8Q1J9_BRUMA